MAFLPGHRAKTAWADVALAHDHDHDGFVVWAATGAQPDPSIALVSRRPGVHAVSLAPAGEDRRRVHAALQLARRLAADAADRAEAGRMCLTSPGMPDTAGELVRVPHLVTLRDSGGALIDTVVWELQPDARRWPDVGTPNSALVEAYLPDLLALRSATRTGQLPAGLSAPLATLLTSQSSPLSIELVRRHLDLFLPQLAEQRGGVV